MKYFTITLILMISINAVAQFKEESFFSSGIIITNKDTITCFIEQYVNYNSKKIKYKINKDEDKALIIESSTINHLRIGLLEYDRVMTDKNSYLMKKLKAGTISLYDYSFEVNTTQHNGFTNTSSMGSVEKEFLYVVGKGKTFKLVKKRFKKDLKSITSDNLDLESKIDDLNFKDSLFTYDLKELISKYNYWFKYIKKGS